MNCSLIKASVLVTIIWMMVIFFLSSQSAQVSNGLSKNVTIILIDLTNQAYGTNFISQIHISEVNSMVRRCAHVGVYIVLSILVINTLRGSRINLLMGYLLAFLICVAFACLDEIHQMFVLGRGAELQDLLMDCIGVLVGLTSYTILRIVK